MNRDLSTDPNRNTAPAGLDEMGEWVHVRGYQDYLYNVKTRELMTEQHRLRSRELLLGDWSWMAGKRVLDLGANGGYWSLKAALSKATVEAFEMDEAYHPILERLGVQVAKEVAALGPQDVVIALALVHWLYDCTARFRDVEKIVDWLAGLAEETLLVEWVDPGDPSIVKHGHLGEDPSRYNWGRFRRALARNFGRVRLLGSHADHRMIYRCDR